MAPLGGLQVVMNGLGAAEEHLKLVTVMFQNMFPAINVNTVKLPTCQRVLLLNNNKETGLIDLRHYLIRAQPVGVSRPIRKLVQRRTLPDLGGLEDISEFMNRWGPLYRTGRRARSLYRGCGALLGDINASHTSSC